MKEDIEKILVLANNAPSGHNAQPWRFVVSGDTIRIENTPEADTTIFNFRQMGSFIGHGAVLENIIIAAAEFGYEAVPAISNCVDEGQSAVSVRLEKREVQKDPLFSFIEKRLVNRTPYDGSPLSETERQELLNAGQKVGRGKVLLAEKKEDKKKLAKAFSVNDRMLFENYAMHEAVFPHINWTKQEEEEKRRGLYLKTLELPPPIQKAFHFFKHWPTAKFLGKLGMGKMAALQNASMYANSSALGALVFEDDTLENYIYTGRLFQRVWLTAAQLGLDLQPLAGTLYVAKKILSGESEEFSKEESVMFTEAHENIHRVFGVDKNKVFMTFRIGRGLLPSAHSLRAEPTIIYT